MTYQRWGYAYTGGEGRNITYRPQALRIPDSGNASINYSDSTATPIGAQGNFVFFAFKVNKFVTTPATRIMFTWEFNQSQYSSSVQLNASNELLLALNDGVFSTTLNSGFVPTLGQWHFMCLSLINDAEEEINNATVNIDGTDYIDDDGNVPALDKVVSSLTMLQSGFGETIFFPAFDFILWLGTDTVAGTSAAVRSQFYEGGLLKDIGADGSGALNASPEIYLNNSNSVNNGTLNGFSFSNVSLVEGPNG